MQPPLKPAGTQSTVRDMELTTAELQESVELIQRALREDLGEVGDLTSQAVLPPEQTATVQVVARKSGRLSGEPIATQVFAELRSDVQWTRLVTDGSVVEPGCVIASITGPVRALLSGERTALNFLTHLSGVATLTSQFVAAVQHTPTVILDTRKTLPGWRTLQKYAVRCGGGANHRIGLFDAILIKDNHLAFLDEANRDIGEVIASAKRFRASLSATVVIEVEVDTLEQLRVALPAGPDIVLLDNMQPDVLRAAVQMRDQAAPEILLEASGGVSLDTVRGIAESGVDRISIGALTHSAPALDIAFDWPR